VTTRRARVSRDLVQVEQEDGITTIVLDDPGSRNALSWGLVRELSEAIVSASDSRCLILRNTPPVFSAGGSIDELLEPKVPLEDLYRAFRSLDEASIPTVAAVDGAAIGAGINLVLCCDVALCTQRSRFDVRFLDVGIHPGGGSLWRLQSAIGTQGAAALTLFGETLDGVEAARRGLVWRCVDEADLLQEAMRLARRAARRDPELVARTKRTMTAALTVGDTATAIDLELEPQRWSMGRPSFLASLRRLRERIGAPPLAHSSDPVASNDRSDGYRSEGKE
jgi:enoyl-CoA hydratase